MSQLLTTLPALPRTSLSEATPRESRADRLSAPATDSPFGFEQSLRDARAADDLKRTNGASDTAASTQSTDEVQGQSDKGQTPVTEEVDDARSEPSTDDVNDHLAESDDESADTPDDSDAAGSADASTADTVLAATNAATNADTSATTIQPTSTDAGENSRSAATFARATDDTASPQNSGNIEQSTTLKPESAGTTPATNANPQAGSPQPAPDGAHAANAGRTENIEDANAAKTVAAEPTVASAERSAAESSIIDPSSARASHASTTAESASREAAPVATVQREDRPQPTRERTASRSSTTGPAGATSTSPNSAAPTTSENADARRTGTATLNPTDTSRAVAREGRPAAERTRPAEPTPTATTPALGRVAEVEAAVRGTTTVTDATTHTVDRGVTLAGSAVDKGATAPALAAATGDRLLDAKVDDQAFTQRLTRGMQSMINQRGGTLNMRLTPPELGDVRISMTIVRDVVSAQFFAQSAEAQTMLDKHMGTLRASLEQQGLTVERLQVHASNSSNGSNASTTGGNENDDAGDAGEGRSRGRRDGEQPGDSSGDQSKSRRGTSFADAFEFGRTSAGREQGVGA
jgi:flagellar hook-length control protein FliK